MIDCGHKTVRYIIREEGDLRASEGIAVDKEWVDTMAREMYSGNSRHAEAQRQAFVFGFLKAIRNRTVWES